MPLARTSTLEGHTYTILDAFSDLAREIYNWVLSYFQSPATAPVAQATQATPPPILDSAPVAPTTPPPTPAPAPVALTRAPAVALVDKRKDQVEASFSKLIGFMGGTVTFNRVKYGFDQVSLPHSGKGTISGIPLWKITQSWLNSSTLSIPKNLQVQVNYATGKITPSGQGLMATTPFGIYNLISITVQTNGCVVFEYVAPTKGKDFGDVETKTFTVSEKQLKETFSKVTWAPLVPDEDEVVQELEGEPNEEEAIAAPSLAQEAVPVSPPPVEAEPVAVETPQTAPSLLNRVTAYVDSNSRKVIIGTVGTAAMVGAYYLGFI